MGGNLKLGILWVSYGQSEPDLFTPVIEDLNPARERKKKSQCQGSNRKG